MISDNEMNQQGTGTAFKIEIRDFAKTLFNSREVLDAYLDNGLANIHQSVIVKQVNNNSRLEIISLHRSNDWSSVKKNDQIDLVIYKGYSLIKCTGHVHNCVIDPDGVEIELTLPQYGQRFEQRKFVRVDIPLRVRLIDNEMNLIFQSKYVHTNNLSIGGMGIFIGKTQLNIGQNIKFELKAYFDAEEQVPETELHLQGTFQITRFIGDKASTKMACGKFLDLNINDDVIGKYIMRYQQFQIRTGRIGVTIKNN